jgi:hypothetical protein
MSNFIKVPLAINPARSFLGSAISVGTLNSGYTGGGTRVAGTSVASGPTTTSGNGSGAAFGITLTGGTFVLAITASTNIGEGYKVGDTITLASKAASTGVTSFSADIVFEITATMLAAIEGSSTNEYALIPIDNVACVSGVSATACDVQILEYNQATSSSAAGKVTKYTITVDDVPATTKAALQADVAAAIIKAASAENAQPEVKFTSDAECISVVLS